MTGANHIVITIDGPAGSGKSSTAKAVAKELGFRHLDSGAFYRAITLAALESEIPTERWDDLSPADLQRFQVSSRAEAAGYRLTLRGEPIGERIRSPEVNAYVSRMAAVPAVRDWLLDALREAGRAGGLVADGRDMGTVVFPDAELKVFLVCAPDERALRRLREQGIADPGPEQIRAESSRLMERDRLDSTRAAAPLLQPDDAVVLDTTGLTFEAQVGAIIELAESRIRG